MNDLIEKLSNLRSQFNCFNENEREVYHTLSEAIKVISDRPEPCEDAVSRTELLHIFEENCYPVHYDHNSIDVGMTLPGIVEVLNIATSVIPKRKAVKWIVHYECPKCGEITKDFTEYCPFCNADMRCSQNEPDKQTD